MSHSDSILATEERLKPDFSVIVATEADDGVAETLATYRDGLDRVGRDYEVIVIVDGRHRTSFERLSSLAEEWPRLTVLGHRPWGGEDAALNAAVRRSRGELILLLPGWSQIDPGEIPRLFDALGDADMVSAVRNDRANGGWQSLRHGLFDGVLRRLFGTTSSDPFCRARLVRRDTMEDVGSFGVRQHFLPVITTQRGHLHSEVEVRAATAQQSEHSPYQFKLTGHIRAMFDALTLYVVLKFLRRPLRFFGAIGLPMFLAGAVATAFLVAGRLLGQTALADRPALIFAVMLLVLGVQIIAIGLVGEIIIFAGARRNKQYEVGEIIASDTEAAPLVEAAEAPAMLSEDESDRRVRA